MMGSPISRGVGRKKFSMPEAVAVDAMDLPVLGMTCAGCVGGVERAIGAGPGVRLASVSVLTNALRLKTYTPPRLTPAGETA